MATTGNATSFLNTITLPELTDLVRRNWVMLQKTSEKRAKSLYIVEEIGSGNGSTKLWNEIDTETYADYKPEGSDAQKSQDGIGYNKTMIARTFAKEIDITLEMRNDNRYREVGTLITNLSSFCENRQDLDLTQRLTFAGSTSYVDRNGYTVDTTVGDGFQLVYNAHTLAFSTITYSNRVTADPAFSEGAYEAALLLAATNIYSNFGEKRQMRFNTIVSGDDPSTKRAISQLLKSDADVDAVQAGIINVYKNGMMHLVLQDLATTALGAYDSTKRRYWFVAATGQGQNGWQAYLGEWIKPTLRTPAPGNNGEDIHSYNWTYSAYCRYGIATVSPKGIIGSLVSN